MATEFDTVRDQYQNYRWAYDNGHSEWVKLAARCFEFWRGNQWDALAKAKLQREGRPFLTLNVVESLIRTMKGVQRALRNDVRFAPTSGASIEDARVQDAVWLDVQNQNMLDFLETDIWEKGLIMGRAYYDVRMNYDESVQGHVRIAPRRSQDIILDPSAEEYAPRTWPQVFHRRWVSVNDIENLYGKGKAEAVRFNGLPSWYDYEDSFMAMQMGRLPYYQYEEPAETDGVRARLLMERQYQVMKRKEVFIDMATGDTSEIPENWDHNRISFVLENAPGVSTMKRNVKTFRWTVTCENVVLHDEDSPYNDYTIVPFFPAFVDGVSKGAVESLLDPQELFNKITSSELHIISTTANSGYKVKKGALQNMTTEELAQSGAKTGFVAELDDINNLEKITPNQTPQGHDRLSFKADQIMRSLSGVSNSGRGFARDDASGDKVLQDQAGQELNFAGWLSNLHRSKQLLAARVQDCVRNHYTETRTIMVNRGTALAPNFEELTLNQPTAEGLMLNDVTRGKYTTTMVPAPSRTTMDEADFRLLVELREKLGIAIPDAMLIELSPASNKSQIIQMLDGDSNERQRAAEAAAAQKEEIEQQKSLAQAQKEEAAAMLNQARAQKFAIEARTDPDAAYREVEGARLQVERDNNDEKNEIERKKLVITEKYQNKQIALRLAELDNARDIAEAKAKEAKTSAPRREKKPRNQKRA